MKIIYIYIYNYSAYIYILYYNIHKFGYIIWTTKYDQLWLYNWYLVMFPLRIANASQSRAAFFC